MGYKKFGSGYTKVRVEHPYLNKKNSPRQYLGFIRGPVLHSKPLPEIFCRTARISGFIFSIGSLASDFLQDLWFQIFYRISGLTHNAKGPRMFYIVQNSPSGCGWLEIPGVSQVERGSQLFLLTYGKYTRYEPM